MPSGGRLTFRATRCGAVPFRIEDDPLERPGDYVEIAVSDSGSGMPEAVREPAFEPFFTTKSPGRGTGLGLSTVYGFTRQSRGAVTLDSAPDAGTTVKLYLPCHADDTPVDASSWVHSGDFRGLHMLLVEDDADVREVLPRYLRGLRCDVTQAPSAEEALHCLGPQGRVDLLVSDVYWGRHARHRPGGPCDGTRARAGRAAHLRLRPVARGDGGPLEGPAQALPAQSLARAMSEALGRRG